MDIEMWELPKDTESVIPCHSATSTDNEEVVRILKQCNLGFHDTDDESSEDHVESTDSDSEFSEADASQLASNINESNEQASRKRKTSDDDIPANDRRSKKRRNLLDDMQMPNDGLKRNQHGTDFQLNLLMLAIWRARIHKFAEFRLATEMPGAEKLDDVVFQSRAKSSQTWTFRLIQAKHKEGTCMSLIDRSNLLAMDDEKDFALQKYFKSMVKITDRCKQNSLYSPFSGATIQDIVLITNTDFCSNELRSCFELDSENDIKQDTLFGFKNMPSTQVFRLSRTKNESLVHNLIPVINTTSDFNQLVHMLSTTIVNNCMLSKSSSLIKEYLFPLRKYVFERSVSSSKDKFYLQFSTQLWDDNQPEEVLSFRNAFVKEVAFLRNPPKFQVHPNFGDNQLPNRKDELEKLANKLSETIENGNTLNPDEYLGYYEVLATSVIDCTTGMFRKSFINSRKKDQLSDFRDLLKEALFQYGAYRKILINKDLESKHIKIPRDAQTIPDMRKEMPSTFPVDIKELEKLADVMAKAFHQNQILQATWSPALARHQTALAKTVLDVSTGDLQKSFIIDNDQKNSKNILLPASVKEFRRILIGKIVPEKAIIETKAYLQRIQVGISEGLAKDFQLNAEPTVQDPQRFARQLYNILTGNSKNTKVVDIKEQSVNSSFSEANSFQANIRTLAEGNALISKFSKIRFSSNFIESAVLPGNLDIFRNDLLACFGSLDSFKTISDYTFHVHIDRFHPMREESILTKLPVPYNDSDFQTFFDKLRIIVNYPNRHILNNLLEEEMRNTFRNLNSKALSALLQGNMQRWMSDRIGTFYTAEKATKLFEDIDRDMLCWPMDGVSRSYFSIVPMKYSFKSSEDQIYRFFSNENRQVLRLIFDHLLLGRIRFVQTFLNMQKYDSIGCQRFTRTFGYIFITLKQLISDKFHGEISRSLRDRDKWNLLIIECNCSKNIAEIYQRLVELVRPTFSSRKIILITEPHDQFPESFQRDPFFEKSYHQNEEVKTSYADLEETSQNLLSERGKLWLQGPIFRVKQLLDDTQVKLIDGFTLVKFISGGRVKIGNRLRFSNGFDPFYYIDRFFNMNVEIEDDMRSGDEIIIGDLEDEFVIASERHGTENKKNIHWLRAINKRHYWQKTHGSISALVPHRSASKELSFDVENTSELSMSPLISQRANVGEKNFLEISSGEKLVIVSNTAGMGKSTLLSNISRVLKTEHPRLWVIRIDLSDYSSFFNQELNRRKTQTSKFCPEDMNSSISFLVELLQSNVKSKLRTDFEVGLFRSCLKQSGRLQLTLLFDAFDEISPTYQSIVLDLLQALRDTFVHKIVVTTRPCMQRLLERTLNVFASNLRHFSTPEQQLFLTRFWKKRLGSTSISELHSANEVDERLQSYVNAIVRRHSNTINDKYKEFTGIPLQLRLLAEIFEKADEEDTWQGCFDFIVASNDLPMLPDQLDILDLYENFVRKKYTLYCKEKMRMDDTIVAAQIESIDSFKTFVKQHEKMALFALFTEHDLKALLSTAGDFEEEMEEIQEYMNRIETGKEMRGIVNQIIDNKPHFVHRTFAEYFVANFLGEALLKRKPQKSLYFALIQIIFNSSACETIRGFFERWLPNKKNKILDSTKRNFGHFIDLVWKESGGKVANFLGIPCQEGCTEIITLICECLDEHKECLSQMINDETTRTGAFSALTSGHMDTVKAMMHYGLDVDNIRFWLAVMQATSKKSSAWKWFVAPNDDGGAGVSIQPVLDADLKLDVFACIGDLELCQWLVSHGMDFDLQGKGGHTPLHRAAQKGHLNIVQWLISIGANKQVRDDHGQTILHYAATHGQLEVCQWLVKSSNEGGAGMDIGVTDNDGMNLLHAASKSTNLKLLEWLLEAGFMVNSLDNFKRSPLHIAARFGSLKVVEFLMNNGADFTVVTKTGDNIFHLAASAPTAYTCKWLVEQIGAGRNIPGIFDKNSEGQTPADIAEKFWRSLASDIRNIPKI